MSKRAETVAEGLHETAPKLVTKTGRKLHVSSGAYSRSAVAARARSIRRRVLKRAGLRAGDLDAATAELLDAYARAQARVELLDAAGVGLDGASDKYWVAFNACQRALRALTAGLDALAGAPERRLAHVLDELADELAGDDGEDEAEDGEADDEPDATCPIVRDRKPASRAASRPAANGAQTAERLDDGPAGELEADDEPAPSPPPAKNARPDQFEPRGAPVFNPSERLEQDAAEERDDGRGPLMPTPPEARWQSQRSRSRWTW